MKFILRLLSLALILTVPTAIARADDQSAKAQTVLTTVAPSIVTIKAVLKMEMKMMGQAQSQEMRAEMQGVVVSPDGLIMLSNSHFSTDAFKQMMGGSAMSDADMGFKITPTEFKVIIEREDKEYPAYLAATDVHLGLAFLKMDELADRKLAFVDFPTAATVTIGQPILAVARLSKGFDYAPYFESARVSGEITKPRQAWVLDSAISELGLPAFGENGDVIGAFTPLASGFQDASSMESMQFSMMMRLISGGGGGHGNLFLVPSSAIAGVIAQAKLQAADVAALRAKSKAAAAAAATTPKKEAPKAATPKAKPPVQ